MGDGVRTSSYDRNTTLDQDDILEKCVRRAYAKDSKASILEELVDKSSIANSFLLCSSNSAKL